MSDWRLGVDQSRECDLVSSAEDYIEEDLLLLVKSVFAYRFTFLLVFISMQVIKARRLHMISLGVGPQEQIAALVIAHSSFVAYVPFFLFLLAVLELSGRISSTVLLVIGAMFYMGRVFHYVAFGGTKMDFQKRKLGMHLTFGPLIAMAVLNLIAVVLRLEVIGL